MSFNNHLLTNRFIEDKYQTTEKDLYLRFFNEFFNEFSISSKVNSIPCIDMYISSIGKLPNKDGISSCSINFTQCEKSCERIINSS